MNNKSAKKTYLMRYEPAKHEGVSNWRNEEFVYHIETAASVEGAFFYAADLDNDRKLKRFVASRVNEVITIVE